MIGTFRGLLSTWPVRVFFFLLACAFALWGVANKNPFGAETVEGASVAGHAVPMADIQTAYRRQLAQFTRSTGQAEPTPEIRRAVAQQAVEQAVTQTALRAKVEQLHLAVPDAALQQAALRTPAFQGKAGGFDRATMQTVLRDNSLTEQRFLELLRADLGEQQLLGAVTAGTRAPDVLTRQVWDFEHETRVADMVAFPFAAVPAQPAPTDAQLHRWYDNNPERYSTPEQRRIKAIVLTPETVGRDIAIPEPDIAAAYEQHRAEYVAPERRSVEVLSGLPDEGAAQALVTQWTTGADWPAMQQAATVAGGTSVELTDATRPEFPAPELADAAFAVPAGTVAPAVHGALGWYVVRVGKVTPGVTRDLAAVHDELRDRLAADKAADQIYDRANRIEDLLAGGSKLDDLPGDLGVAAVTGTLDAAGRAPSGEPAPLPGSDALRSALIAAAFAAHENEAPKLTQLPGGGQGYFAVTVEGVIPPAAKPFDAVSDAVRADWTRDAARRAADAAAARLLAAVQDGKALADAASAAGVEVHRMAPSGRDQPGAGVPTQLLPPLFSLRAGEATMVETPDGFVVAVLAAIEHPDPAADAAGFSQLRETLGRSIAGDIEATFATATRDGGHAKVNPKIYSDLAQVGE